MNQEPRLLRELLEVANLYKGIVLDSVEQELGDHANWKYIRSRLLRAFGDRGLEGRIREIIKAEFSNQAGVQMKLTDQFSNASEIKIRHE